MNKKKYGKVTKYNGMYGNIKCIDGKDYLLLDKNSLDEINLFDNVQFEAEEYKSSELYVDVARFVKVLSKDKGRSK